MGTGLQKYYRQFKIYNYLLLRQNTFLLLLYFLIINLIFIQSF